MEGPGSPAPALRPVEKSEAFGLPCLCRRPSVCPGFRITHLLSCMGAKVGGAGLPGPCPTASGNVGGLRPALPMSETFGLPRVLCRSPSVINGCQSWRDRAPRSLPYGQWKCRRPSACPAFVGDHRSVQGSVSLTFYLVSCGVVACRRILARIFGARQTSLAKWEGDSFHALGVWRFPLSIFGEGSFLPADSLTVLEGYRVPLMGGWPGLFDSAGVPATGAGASNAGSLGLFGNRPTLDYLDSGGVADLLRDSVKGILLREPAVASSLPRSLVTEEVVAGMGCARSFPDSAKSFAS